MLRVGIEGEGRLTVTENDTAAAVGSGSLRVFATPAMAALMEKVAADPFKKIGETEIVAFRNYNEDFRLDFATGKKESIGFEPSNVLYFELAGGGFFVIRPSGTEPKIKFYYSVPCKTMAEGNTKIDALDKAVKEKLL